MLAVVWITPVEFGCAHKQPNAAIGDQVSHQKRSLLVAEIRALRGSEHWNDFDVLDWDAYLTVAKKMLSVDEFELRDAFKACDLVDDQDKLFLLNRLIFDSSGKHPEFFGWYHVPKNFPGEIYQWPVQWMGDRPEFFSTALAFDGKPYNGLTDYLQRKECLPLRQL